MSALRLLILLLFIGQVSPAQSTRPSYGTDRKKKPKPYVYPPNVVKLNLSGLFMKSVGVQLEHRLTPRLSIAGGVSYRPNSGLLLYKFMADSAASFGLSPETAQSLRTARFGSITVTPELRYYFKKRAPKGLYLCPFLRYRRDTWKYDYVYQESNQIPSVSKQGTLTLRENSLGIGLLFGLHVVSKKKFAIDFWFLGPWAGFNRFSLRSPLNAGGLNEFDKAIIASKVESLINSDNFPVKWSSKGIESTGTQPAYGLRMVGINVGYNF